MDSASDFSRWTQPQILVGVIVIPRDFTVTYSRHLISVVSRGNACAVVKSIILVILRHYACTLNLPFNKELSTLRKSG